MVLLQVFVPVPIDAWTAKGTTVENLNEAHAAFEKPPGHQAIAREAFVRFFVEAVQFLCRVGFAIKVRRLGNADLHSGGEFIRAQPCGKRAVPWMHVGIIAIHRGEQFHIRIAAGCDLRRSVQIHDWLAQVGAERNALVVRGQEARGPIDRAAGDQAARVRQHDKRGKVFVLGAQPITQPCAHARKSVHREAAVHLESRGRVIVALRKHRVDETHVIDATSEVRQQAADPRAALAVLAKTIDALHHLPRLAEETEVLAFAFESLAVETFQLWLVIKRVDVADATAAENLHHPFRFGRKVRRARRGNTVDSRRLRLFAIQQPCQRDATETARGVPQKMAARK